jgi:hypothetical protein
MSQALDWGLWLSLSLTRTRIYLIGRVEVRKAREGARRSNFCCVRTSEPHENCITSGSPLCRVDQGHLHPLHRASETEASQSRIEPGTSCTAGEHSMQRAIRMALLTAIRNLGLYYYNTNENISKMFFLRLFIFFPHEKNSNFFPVFKVLNNLTNNKELYIFCKKLHSETEDPDPDPKHFWKCWILIRICL